MKNILSIDVGNSEIKAIGSDGVTRMQIPNVIAYAGAERAVREMEETVLESLHVKISEEEFGTKCFTVGKLATKNEFANELSLLSEKSSSKQSLVLLLTVAALDAIQKQQFIAEENGSIEAKYVLSLGLPISQSGSKNRAELNYLLKKRYYVEFLNTKNISGKKVILEFSDIQINTEALAAYATMLTKQSDLSKKSLMIYDIGGLTNDVSVVANNQVVNDLSNSYKEGLAVVLDNIKEKLSAKFNYRLNSRQQVIDLLKRDRADWEITVFGKEQSIAYLIDVELNQYANKILQHIQSLWYKAPQIECCYIIGGGALLLKTYIDNTLELNKMDMSIRYLDKESSLWANVQGYALIANKLFANVGDKDGWAI